MYKPYVLQGIVMLVLGFSILILLVLPYALSGFPNDTVSNGVLYTYSAPAASCCLIAVGAYRIYEAFK